MNNNFKMVAKTLFGFEEVLAKELKDLGALNIELGNRSVSFEGDTGFMYKANLCLRTATKILKPIASFKVSNEDSLYRQVAAMDWISMMDLDTTFAIDTTVYSEEFTHSLYVSQKVKDAIVDTFREATGARPNVDVKHPDLKLNVHIQQDQCTISLDSSGRSLHIRGYKTATNIAPINEVLAAGILLLSGWEGQSHFIDPMCGSGTILIEAAMIACNIPPNINRKEFAFEKWSDFDSELFQTIIEVSLKKTKDFPYTIKGYDKAPSAVRKAQDNINEAQLEDFISVARLNFFETEKEDPETNLHMVFNPPYGERLDVEMQQFYGDIGNTLKKSYPGTQAWFITSNLEALKFVGLKPSRKIKVFNSQLEARLVKFEMYAGSKRAKFNPLFIQK
jgi:putative N6-adenine-specific DNA methylase